MKRLLAVGVLCFLLVSCGPPQDGHGTHEFDDGTKYVGEWKDGEMHGQGTYTDADGGKYVGEFKDGKQHGQGTQSMPNGDKYVGEFKDGKFHGQGTWVHSDGGKYVGEWKYGVMQEATNYDKDGNVIARSEEDEAGDAWNAYMVNDYATALRKFRLVAEMEGEFAGFANEQLGVLYWKGYGVPQDNVYAHMWFNIAVLSGAKPSSDPDAYSADLAKEYRDIVAKKMTPAEIAKAEKLTSECVAKKYKGC